MLDDTQPVKATKPRAAAGTGSPERAPAQPPRRPRSRLILLGLALGLVAASVVLGILVHWVARDLTVTWVNTGFNPFQGGGGDNPLATPAPGVTATLGAPQVEPAPWNGEERVTVLLMGLDYRDWMEGSGPPRTDSMMLVTYDPVTQQAGMLSIPRDLWVEIPGFGHHRINTAYPLGEANRLPGGGAGLAMLTVESLLGVPIPYYMIIEFSAFERMIDEIGGIDVLVREPIRIAPIGGPSMQLEAKPYHFDGPQALAYARVRSGPEADFGRARRQQQVALAIIDRVVGIDALPTLIIRAPALYQELSSGIWTNLSLDQMVSLAWLAVQTSPDQVQRGVIAPPNMVRFYTMPDGANVLQPVPDQIRLLRDQIFTGTSAYGPSIAEPTP